ncbi:MAG: DJ-1/PfpI family protein [Polyangiaceae bacterium]|jgi:transcriptional regulator GlxA family with amidase domain
MAPHKTVGALLFEGFELLDVFGPLEAWGMLASAGGWKIVTTAASAGAVASAQGPCAVADCSLEDCPKVDVLLVPGGVGTRREVTHEVLLEWLRRRSSEAEVVTSVCTGAALLARAGLLDGRRATTNKASFGWVVEQGPAVTWVKEARWVEDGPFVTSSGVSAGIDMTLAVIARLASHEVAERIAVRMEYDWHSDASWDPFANVHGLV